MTNDGIKSYLIFGGNFVFPEKKCFYDCCECGGIFRGLHGFGGGLVALWRFKGIKYVRFSYFESIEKYLNGI